MSLTRVIMPKTGADMEEGRILAWKKNAGERIEKGEVLLEIETDKATMEVESPAAGVLLKRFYKEGEVVPAARLIAVVGQGNEPVQEWMGWLEAEASGEPEPKALSSAGAPEPAEPATQARGRGSIKASPLARRLATEKGIDLASIQGSAPSGRIEKEDVLRAVEVRDSAPASRDSLISLSAMRRAIGRRMVRSKREAADFSLTMALDMTAALRRKKELQVSGKEVSISDLVIFAVARALVEHPDVNAQLEGDAIRRHDGAQIGFAVGTEDGLYVPVIRAAEKMQLEEIAAETQRLIARAEGRQLKEEEMSGGTFTVTNLGMFGVESFTAIINPPQTGILAVGSVTDRATRTADDKLVWRPFMYVTLTVDHRVVDGLAAAKFLADLKNRLEAL